MKAHCYVNNTTGEFCIVATVADIVRCGNLVRTGRWQKDDQVEIEAADYTIDNSYNKIVM